MSYPLPDVMTGKEGKSCFPYDRFKLFERLKQLERIKRIKQFDLPVIWHGNFHRIIRLEQLSLYASKHVKL